MMISYYWDLANKRRLRVSIENDAVTVLQYCDNSTESSGVDWGKVGIEDIEDLSLYSYSDEEIHQFYIRGGIYYRYTKEDYYPLGRSIDRLKKLQGDKWISCASMVVLPSRQFLFRLEDTSSVPELPVFLQKQFEVEQRAQDIYNKLKEVSDGHFPNRTDLVVHFSKLLRSFYTTDSTADEFRLINNWLVDSKGGDTDQAKVWCIKKLLIVTDCGGIAEGKSDNELIELVDKKDLKDASPYFTALISEVVANELLEQYPVLRQLSDFMLSCIVQVHEGFAVGLLEHPNRIKQFYIRLLQIARAHKGFVTDLLGQYPNLIEQLSGHQLSGIAEAHEDFAFKLLELPEVLRRLEGHELIFIADAHTSFRSRLLQERPELLENLEAYQLRYIAHGDADFLDHLLSNLKVIQVLKSSPNPFVEPGYLSENLDLNKHHYHHHIIPKFLVPFHLLVSGVHTKDEYGGFDGTSTPQETILEVMKVMEGFISSNSSRSFFRFFRSSQYLDKAKELIYKVKNSQTDLPELGDYLTKYAEEIIKEPEYSEKMFYNTYRGCEFLRRLAYCYAKVRLKLAELKAGPEHSVDNTQASSSQVPGLSGPASAG